jgi:hypothetical protein
MQASSRKVAVGDRTPEASARKSVRRDWVDVRVARFLGNALVTRSALRKLRTEAQRNKTGRQSHASEILWKAPYVRTARPPFTRNGKAVRMLPPVAPKRCAFCGAASWEQVGLPEGVMHITWFECLDCGNFTMQTATAAMRTRWRD